MIVQYCKRLLHKLLVGGTMVDVGLYDMVNEKIFINYSLINWHNGQPPKDRFNRIKVIVKPNIIIQLLLMILAFLGQILAIVFLAVNIRYRKTR